MQTEHLVDLDFNAVVGAFHQAVDSYLRELHGLLFLLLSLGEKARPPGTNATVMTEGQSPQSN
jgi:hypothetical protein